MFVIEKLIRLFKQLKGENIYFTPPDVEDNYQLEDVLTCRHNFMPIDSTGEILACSKCGYVISKKRLKN